MDRYKSLRNALKEAGDQAEFGKGKERHADGELFEQQKICVIGRWLRESPVAGPLQQAVKKMVESSKFDPARAIHEINGAINYAGAAVILLKEMVDEAAEDGESGGPRV